jgi:hypothetical protein
VEKKAPFKINLIKRHVVPIGLRNVIIYSLDAMIIAGILWSGILWKEAVQMRSGTVAIKSKFTPIDYGYAKGLQTKREMLKNGQ